MADLIREERYIFSLGAEQHLLRVQELVSASANRPYLFRVQLAASSGRAAKTFYGATAAAVLDMAVAYLSELLTAMSDPLGEDLANPIQLVNLPNRLSCADIVWNTDKPN